MSNATALARLNAQIARVRTLPSTLPQIAARAAVKVRAILAANVAAGRGPDGKPWQKTQDGKPALTSAMSAVDVRAVGSAIVIAVDGVEARHHQGAVRGGVRREIIPSRTLPDAMAQALDEVAQEVLAEAML